MHIILEYPENHIYTDKRSDVCDLFIIFGVLLISTINHKLCKS